MKMKSSQVYYRKRCKTVANKARNTLENKNTEDNTIGNPADVNQKMLKSGTPLLSKLRTYLDFLPIIEKLLCFIFFSFLQ